MGREEWGSLHGCADAASGCPGCCRQRGRGTAVASQPQCGCWVCRVRLTSWAEAQGQQPQRNGFSPLCVCMCRFRWPGVVGHSKQRRHEYSSRGGSGGPHPVLLPHNTAPHLWAPHTAGRLGLAFTPWLSLDPWLAPQLHSPHLVRGRPRLRCRSARREPCSAPRESPVRQTGEETSTQQNQTQNSLLVTCSFTTCWAPPFNSVTLNTEHELATSEPGLTQ